jgi:hypothetical protein
LPYVHWQSIESGATGGGIPDLNGCFAGVEVWIECKRATGKTLTRCSEIRPTQIAWAERRVRHFGRVFLAIRRHDKTIDELLLYPASALRQFHDGAWLGEIKPLIQCAGGPAKWHWNTIEQMLFGKPL